MANLPNWHGADEAYRRAYVWTAAVNARAYASAKDKRRWVQPDDVTEMINALNQGDEETIKGLNHRHIADWIA